MNRFQQQVLEFHRKFGAPDGSEPFKRRELRAKLMLEEVLETIESLGVQVSSNQGGHSFPLDYNELSFDVIAPVDEVGTIDGLCDTIVVTLGTAIEMGYDLEPAFNEVHRSNMAKEGGTTRADGKILKPEGWTPPDISSVLAAQRGPVKEYEHQGARECTTGQPYGHCVEGCGYVERVIERTGAPWSYR